MLIFFTRIIQWLYTRNIRAILATTVPKLLFQLERIWFYCIIIQSIATQRTMRQTLWSFCSGICWLINCNLSSATITCAVFAGASAPPVLYLMHERNGFKTTLPNTPCYWEAVKKISRCVFVYGLPGRFDKDWAGEILVANTKWKIFKQSIIIQKFYFFYRVLNW